MGDCHPQSDPLGWQSHCEPNPLGRYALASLMTQTGPLFTACFFGGCLSPVVFFFPQPRQFHEGLGKRVTR